MVQNILLLLLQTKDKINQTFFPVLFFFFFLVLRLHNEFLYVDWPLDQSVCFTSCWMRSFFNHFTGLWIKIFLLQSWTLNYLNILPFTCWFCRACLFVLCFFLIGQNIHVFRCIFFIQNIFCVKVPYFV